MDILSKLGFDLGYCLLIYNFDAEDSFKHGRELLQQLSYEIGQNNVTWEVVNDDH